MKIKKFINAFLYIYAFTVVFENYDGLSLGGNSIPKLFGFFLIILILADKFQFYNIKTRKFVIPTLYFLLSISVSCLINYNYSMEWLWRYNTILSSILIFIIYLSYAHDKKEVLDNMFFSFNMGILVMGFLYLFNIGITYEDNRIEIFGENPNTIGIFSVFCVIYILSIFFEKIIVVKYKLLYLFALIPLFNMIANSGSRTTFIGLVISLCIFFIFKKNTKSNFWIKIFGIISIYLIIQYILTFDVMSKRLELAVDKGDLSGRDTIWEDILPYILDKPIFGLGVDGYFDVISIFFGKFFSPHNVFIEILAYGGLVAFTIFFFFYYRLINISIYLKSKEDYILPIVLLQFILQIFSAGQGLTSKPFWMIYIYIIGTYIYSKSMKKNITHN